MKVHGKGIIEGAASDLQTLCARWIGKAYEVRAGDSAWDIAERVYAAHLKDCLICQTMNEFCKHKRVKTEKRWLTLKSQKAQATHGGYIWFWRAKPSAKNLDKVPYNNISGAGAPDGTWIMAGTVDRSKPVFSVKLWSRASLVGKMKTNPDDPLVQRIDMLLLAREHDVPRDEWANVVAEGEALLSAEASQ